MGKKKQLLERLKDYFRKPRKQTKMNYWHMQLNKSDEKISPEKIIKILDEKGVVGMGTTWKDKKDQFVKTPQVFREDVAVGDIIMIRKGRTPVALVKVASEPFIEENTDEELDWFPIRRKVVVLDYFKDNEMELSKIRDAILKKYGAKYLQAMGTFSLCSNPKTATSEFIRKWEKKVMSDER